MDRGRADGKRRPAGPKDGGAALGRADGRAPHVVRGSQRPFQLPVRPLPPSRLGGGNIAAGGNRAGVTGDSFRLGRMR